MYIFLTASFYQGANSYITYLHILRCGPLDIASIEIFQYLLRIYVDF